MSNTKKKHTLLQPVELSYSKTKNGIKEWNKKYNGMKKEMKDKMYESRVIIYNKKGSEIFK